MPKRTTSASIWLPYFKQGDDLDGCIKKDENGKTNAKLSLQNHINLLQCAIEKLQNIMNEIPEDQDVDFDADTHHISIKANEKIIKNLIDKELVEEESDYDYDEDSEKSQEIDDSNETLIEENDNENNNKFLELNDSNHKLMEEASPEFNYNDLDKLNVNLNVNINL